jgi:hypothetical protein
MLSGWRYMGDVMSDLEKEKQKRTFSRSRRWLLLLFIPAAACMVVIILALVGAYVLDDEIKSSLDTAYLPIAENLLEHPLPDSEYMRLRVFGNGSSANVCIYYSSPVKLAGGLEIYLNAAPANFPWSIGMSALSGGEPDHWDNGNRCTFQKLDPGIHLLEVRLKASPQTAPFYVHQWAFVTEG